MASSTSEQRNPLVPVEYTKGVNGLDKVILRGLRGVSAEVFFFPFSLFSFTFCSTLQFWCIPFLSFCLFFAIFLEFVLIFSVLEVYFSFIVDFERHFYVNRIYFAYV